MDCLHCGHRWIEGVVSATARVPAAPEANALVVAMGPDTRRLLDAARKARNGFGQERRTRRRRLAAWGGLALLALSPLVVALAFPEAVLSVLPATIHLYQHVGRTVNLYGLDIQSVEVQHLVIDGRKVIAVKGDIANTSGTEQKVPMLDLALRTSDNGEVYHSTVAAEQRTLAPGESTSFLSRLTSPPEAARNLEIRFARADEIGSNAAHE